MDTHHRSLVEMAQQRIELSKRIMKGQLDESIGRLDREIKSRI
jgi:hypothetical protein